MKESKLTETATRIVDNLDSLVDVLPERVKTALGTRESIDDLLEVVLDLGRPPEARFHHEQVLLDAEEVTDDDIQWVIGRVGKFGDDNRAGIERTLHRISVMRNRLGRPVGLSCRVGRAVFGTIRIIKDIVFSGESILLMGRPGVGKTTMLREIARVLADDAGKRVVIVDTSNEIAGDGDVPHPAIGRARRMQVASTPQQHQVMIEAVENHMPEVIIIDEMSTELEALAARTIAERGVQLIATAHGNTLDNLVSNPSLSDLVGGTQTVTLGDIEARRRRTQKTVLERKYQPTFSIVVEIHDWNHVGVHRDVARVVDDMLRGFATETEMRWLDENGQVQHGRHHHEPRDLSVRDAYSPGARARSAAHGAPLEGIPPASDTETRSPSRTRVVAFGIPRPLLESEVSRLGVAVEMVKDLEAAEMLVTTKSHYSRRPTAVRVAEQNGMPVYVLRKGSTEQIRRFLQRFERATEPSPAGISGWGDSRSGRMDELGADDGVREALNEAETGIRRVLAGERRVELEPRAAYVRRLQHGLASRRNVGSVSFGNDPTRRVVLRRRRR